ncbi:MAG: hypothetical protein SO058_04860, partial [Agathobaculum sp.]|nr:hypothetical protein [Agathobaculum sp.]
MAWLLTVAMVASLLPSITPIAQAAYTPMPPSSAILQDSVTYEFPAETKSYTANYVITSGIATVRIPTDANITVNGSAGAPFTVKNDAELILVINGKLTVNGGEAAPNSYAGINVVSDAKLTILTEHGDGKTSGTLIATAGLCGTEDGNFASAAGIGGNGYGDGVTAENCGTIYIGPHTNITAIAGLSGGRGAGAGIGGGGGGNDSNGGNGGRVIIYGSVYAEGGGGDYTDGGGAGIGGGGSSGINSNAGAGGYLSIMSGASVTTKSSQTVQPGASGGAGIGGGGTYSRDEQRGGYAGTIYIQTDTYVEAIGGNCNASTEFVGVGIGGGSGAVAGSGGTVLIERGANVVTKLGTGGTSKNFQSALGASGEFKYIGSGCGHIPADSSGILQFIDYRINIAETTLNIGTSETYYDSRKPFGGSRKESRRHAAGGGFRPAGQPAFISPPCAQRWEPGTPFSPCQLWLFRLLGLFRSLTLSCANPCHGFPVSCVLNPPDSLFLPIKPCGGSHCSFRWDYFFVL